jgi:hypothetical protein
MTESQKATRWRVRLNLTPDQLSELTGYSKSAIYWFERGETPPSRKGSATSGDITPWVWQRYKAACGYVDAVVKSGEKFRW